MIQWYWLIVAYVVGVGSCWAFRGAIRRTLHSIESRIQKIEDKI